MTDSQVYAGAAMLGIAAGMRSMSSPAIVCGLAHTGLLPAQNRQLEIMAHPASVTTTALLAAGELIADKLPFIPARITPGPLVTRAISGALCGSAILSAKKRSVLFGALVGACAAVGSSYVAYYTRRYLGQRTGIPDPVLAVLEDAVVAAGGWLLYQSLKADENNLAPA